MTTAIADVREKLDKALEQGASYLERDDFNAEDPGYIAVKGEAEALTRSYNEMLTWESRRSESDKIGDALSRIERKQNAAKDETKTREDNISLGERFVRSDQFRTYNGYGAMSRVEVEDTPLMRAMLTTDTDPAKLFIQADKTSFVPKQPVVTTPLLSLSNSVQVSSGNVSYIVDGPTPVAAVVPEGSLKPEAVLSATQVDKVLETIAHHVVVSRQALQDSNQLRSWIDGKLVRGVALKLEELCAAALNAAVLPTATGADLLSSIRVGIAEVQLNGYTPNAIAINPADAAAIDIAIMSGTLGGAQVQGGVWGLALAPVASIPVGSPVVGDFTGGLTTFYRTGTELLITDSHADLFLRNAFVILAERRALSDVTTADALVRCSIV